MQIYYKRRKACSNPKKLFYQKIKNAKRFQWLEFLKWVPLTDFRVHISELYTSWIRAREEDRQNGAVSLVRKKKRLQAEGLRPQNPDALTTVRSYSTPSSAMLPTVRSLPLFALLFLLALSPSSASESDHKVSSLFLPFKIISSSLLVDTSIIPYIFTFFSDRLVATQMQESFHRGSRFSRHFLALIERSLVSFGLVCGYCWD